MIMYMTFPLLTADEVTNLVAKAFVLEAITDKPDCTTRYHDLPGKPLQDFIIAGINSAPYLGKLVGDTSGLIFKHAADALGASTKHKSPKYINFGLLEIMFPVVYTRLRQNDQGAIADSVIQNLKNTTNEDFGYMQRMRKLAWTTTSSQSYKNNFPYHTYADSKSVWEYYLRLLDDLRPDESGYQWAEQHKLGLPVLQDFLKAYTEQSEIMDTTKTVFLRTRQQHPDLKIGIIADMCAAAIFLWLSFHDSPV